MGSYMNKLDGHYRSHRVGTFVMFSSLQLCTHRRPLHIRPCLLLLRTTRALWPHMPPLWLRTPHRLLKAARCHQTESMPVPFSLTDPALGEPLVVVALGRARLSGPALRHSSRPPCHIELLRLTLVPQINPWHLRRRNRDSLVARETKLAPRKCLTQIWTLSTRWGSWQAAASIINWASLASCYCSLSLRWLSESH